MAGELKDRTAIVTGASRGIGLAISEALVEAGANVVLTSRTQEAAARPPARPDLRHGLTSGTA